MGHSAIQTGTLILEKDTEMLEEKTKALNLSN